MSNDPNDWNPLLPPLDVPDRQPVNTGIIDVQGRPIFKPLPPLGFHVPNRRGPRNG